MKNKYFAKRGTPVQNYFGKGEWVIVPWWKYMLLDLFGYKTKKEIHFK